MSFQIQKIILKLGFFWNKDKGKFHMCKQISIYSYIENLWQTFYTQVVSEISYTL